MAELRTTFAGIKSPNPFWLASAPPTDKAYNVVRAFKAGWGGVVWKTLGEDGPPIVNTASRYGALEVGGMRMVGFTNIELITDRPLQVNLDEIKQVKRDWPDRALVVSLMVPCVEDSWKTILKKVEETNADGVELNFGCPHGMSERGMGAAVGQVPDYVEMVTRWCKQHTRMPVLVKLTPNVTSILGPARAAKRGGADGVSLINTVNSIIGVDLERMAPQPVVVHYGFKIIDDMVDGLSNWLDAKGHAGVTGILGRAVPNVTDWQHLDLNYKTVALIDQEACIKCGLCHIACEDTSHQAIAAKKAGSERRYEVIDADCVGCNLCMYACPVTDCISMVEVATGKGPLTWLEHPNNPLRQTAK